MGLVWHPSSGRPWNGGAVNTREIRTSLDSELYRELESAMLNHTLYEGCYVMQYSEHNEHEGKVAVFLLREVN